MEEKMNEYYNTKDVRKRNDLLKKIMFSCPMNGKEFFYQAF